MKLKNALFEHEVVHTTKTFGRDKGLRVVFEGDGAFTDGDTVTLPALGDHELTEREQRIMRGYVDHEAGHKRYSQLDLMEAASAEHKALGALLNGLEDVRIDALTAQHYPGAGKNIMATAEAATEFYLNIHKEDPSIAQDHRKIAPVAITWAGRKAAGLAGPEVDRCLDTLDPGFRQAVEAAAGKAMSAKSTKEVFAIARRVFEDLQYEPPMDQQQQQPQNGNGNGGGGNGQKDDTGKGDTGSGDAEGQGDGSGEQDDKADGGDGKGSSSGDAKGDGQKDGQGNGADGGQQEQGNGGGQQQAQQQGGNGSGAGGAGDPLDPDLKDAVNKAAGADPNKQGGGVSMVRMDSVEWLDFDVTTPTTYESQRRKIVAEKKHYAENYNTVVTRDLAGAIGVMAKTFERVLASTMMRNRERGLEQGRLDGRRLVQAYAGRPNVFWMPAERIELDTYVHVLVDLSSSMNDSKYDAQASMFRSLGSMAGVSAIAVGETLERMGIPWGATGFMGITTHNSVFREKAKRLMTDALGDEMRRQGHKGTNEELVKKDPQAVVAWHYHLRKQTVGVKTCLMVGLKAERERLREAKWKLGAISAMPSGGTPTAEAMMELWPVVAKRTEKRRVVLLLTDGAPNNIDAAVSAIDQYERAGVPVVCIGMFTDIVKQMTKVGRYAVVNDVKSLTGSMLDELRKVMVVDGRQRRAA